MDYTKEKNHLDSLYAAAHLSLDSKNILEIPTFVYHGCQISVSYLPQNEDTNNPIIAIKIRTSQNVTFTPFYLTKDKENEETYNVTTFFGEDEYYALKKEIFSKDNWSPASLFEDIGEHILKCTKDDVISCNSSLWETYKKNRTVYPKKDDDDVLPMTIRNVCIGDRSEKRIRRMFPSNEAALIVNALRKANKTIVFTSSPDKARNIYALLDQDHILFQK